MRPGRMVPCFASMTVASGGAAGAWAAGPAYWIRPSLTITQPWGTGALPVPSNRAPLRMTVLPLPFFIPFLPVRLDFRDIKQYTAYSTQNAIGRQKQTVRFVFREK